MNEPSTAEAKFSTAFNAFLSGADSIAEHLCRESLEQMRSSKQEDIHTVQCLHTLARICFSRGHIDEAEALFQEGLSICEHLIPSDDYQTSLLQSQLGDLYRVQGRYAEAEELIVKSIELCEAAMGVNNQLLDCSLEYYAALLEETGRVAMAQSVKERIKHLQPLTKGEF